MGIVRGLEGVHQGLVLLARQGGVVGFLTNTKNAQRINDLVEDIRQAMMDYQVCLSNDSFLLCLMNVLDLVATKYLRYELSAHCKSHHPAFGLCSPNQ